MTHQTKMIVAVISMIPKGVVASYGQVAEIAGYKGGARQVSRTLRTQTKKYELPWHRVINSQGKISIKNEGAQLQRKLLESEGVIVSNDYKINLNQFKWFPTPIEIGIIEDKARKLDI